MTSIEDINSNSDSEDCDYVPHEEELSDASVDESEDEPAVEEKEFRGKGKKTKKKITETEVNSEDQQPECSDAHIKQRTEDIWKKFLDDVGTSSVKREITDTESANNDKKKSEAKCTDLKLDSDKHLISLTNVTTDVFEFAGETVTITKETKDTSSVANVSSSDSLNISSDSKAQSKPPIKRQGGLGSLIGSITNKKPKMTVLQKSLHDWNNFKKEEGLEEDLEKFNKGKGGFLEKQAFLQRSDIRQFELEKSLRLANKTKR